VAVLISNSLICRVLKKERLNIDCLEVHIYCLYNTGEKNELFLLGHDLMDALPDHFLSWMAIGAYYLLAARFQDARRFFG
jgi:hypothetical protein